MLDVSELTIVSPEQFVFAYYLDEGYEVEKAAREAAKLIAKHPNPSYRRVLLLRLQETSGVEGWKLFEMMSNYRIDQHA